MILLLYVFRSSNFLNFSILEDGITFTMNQVLDVKDFWRNWALSVDTDELNNRKEGLAHYNKIIHECSPLKSGAYRWYDVVFLSLRTLPDRKVNQKRFESREGVIIDNDLIVITPLVRFY